MVVRLDLRLYNLFDAFIDAAFRSGGVLSYVQLVDRSKTGTKCVRRHPSIAQLPVAIATVEIPLASFILFRIYLCLRLEHHLIPPNHYLLTTAR